MVAMPLSTVEVLALRLSSLAHEISMSVEVLYLHPAKSFFSPANFQETTSESIYEHQPTEEQYR